MAITLAQTSDTAAQEAKEAQAAQVEEQVEVTSPEVETAPEVDEGATLRKEVPEEHTVSEAAPAVKEQTKEVVASQPSAAPAERISNSHSTVDILADEGFEGLELTGLSFPRIKLSNGQFQIGQDARPIGTTFKGVITETKPVYVFKNIADSDDAEVFYTYDKEGEYLSDGSSSEPIISEWLEKGYNPNEHTGKFPSQKYLEVVVVVTGSDDEEVIGETVICQIPPASIARFSGYLVTATKRQRKAPSEFETQFKVGRLIKKSSSISYTPWEVSLAK